MFSTDAKKILISLCKINVIKNLLIDFAIAER